MKKLILIFIFFTNPLFIYAQKLEKIKVDPLNGDTIISTKTEVLQNKFSLVMNYLAVSVNKITIRSPYDKSYFLNFEIKTGVDKPFSIYKKSKTYIKFNDGSILELYAFTDRSTDFINNSGSTIGTSYVSGSNYHQITQSYELTKENINILKNNQISFIRIETSYVNFDYEIKPKNSELIKKHLILLN